MKCNNGDKKHVYHFVLDSQLKKDIERIAGELTRSISKTIVFMLETMLPVVHKWCFMDNEEDNRPEVVNWEEGAYVYIDNSLYRQIKLLRVTMNVFSTAMIFREAVRLFIKYYDRFGLERLVMVVERYKDIKFCRFRKSGKFDKMKINKELLYKKSAKKHIQFTINNMYQLITIKKLQ